MSTTYLVVVHRTIVPTAAAKHQTYRQLATGEKSELLQVI